MYVRIINVVRKLVSLFLNEPGNSEDIMRCVLFGIWEELSKNY